MLYQNDGFGKDYLIGLKDGLGADHAGMVIKEASYETSEPTVDLQIVSLQGSGADILLIAATPKFAAQAIRKSLRSRLDAGALHDRRFASIAAVMKPAGLEKSKGRDHRHLRQGPDRRALEGRSGLQGMRRLRARNT